MHAWMFFATDGEATIEWVPELLETCSDDSAVIVVNVLKSEGAMTVSEIGGLFSLVEMYRY